MLTTTEYVVLVDENDQPIGLEEKLKAHQLGLLHRAFSVFLYRYRAGQLELLLQQRAATKYHGPNLWSNACCSHPRQNETVLAASTRRLHEELGVSLSPHLVGHFQYRAEFANGLIEHEYDYVLIDEYNGSIDHFNPDEVAAVQWLTVTELQQQLKASPELFTPWLAEALEVVLASEEGQTRV